MPTYFYKNRNTGEVVQYESSIADIDNFYTDIGDTDRTVWFRIIQKPNVLKTLIPSGFGIRQNDPAWQIGKEAARLEDSTLNLPVQSKERAEIKAEVRKMKESLK